MIHARDLYEKMLGGLLSLSATFNQPLSGSLWQEILLRQMGARVAGPVIFGPGTLIRAPKNLQLGRYVSIGVNARISCWAQVSIADDFIAPDDLTINSGGHDPITLRPINKPIRIGSRVWCGERVTICSGVNIGDDVVIGAGAVVVRSVDSNTVVAGVPARPLRVLQREPGQLWSCWPERSDFHDFNTRRALVKSLIKMRNRF